MKITKLDVSVGELINGYVNAGEEGVTGYKGRLNIRPKYQREFVYKEKQQQAVIQTVMKGLPLNTIYWAVNEDGTYELLDGQQRTMSICEFTKGAFSVGGRQFSNLTKDELERFKSYKLMVYVCEGVESEKLDWFRTINIAGAQLTEQELRNATYTGKWLSDAKAYFSKTGCPAYVLTNGDERNKRAYMSGDPIRQDYLETALEWICDKQGLESVEEYMAAHQHDTDAMELESYFEEVISWVSKVFPNYRKEMKGIDWGVLYNKYKDAGIKANKEELEARVRELYLDEEVTKKKGIYEYVFSNEERVLSLRGFTDRQKLMAYERQKGICPYCKKHFEFDEMEGDHIVPWSKGGKTTDDNLQMLCRKCNNTKGGR